MISLLSSIFVIKTNYNMGETATQQENMYHIPKRYREMENLHIVFWLFKDVAWCMVWKPLGIVMIVPTLLISIVIAWRTRHIVAELCHNLAITIWISANSFWMLSEFAGIDTKPLFGAYTYKHLAIIPFSMGIFILAYYYLWYAPRHRQFAKS